MAQCASQYSVVCRVEVGRNGISASRQRQQQQQQLQHCLPACLTFPSRAPCSPLPSHCLLSSPFWLSARSSSSNTRLCAAASSSPSPASKEEVFFDGGPHIGDLVTNLVFGLTLLWLPLTLASVFRALFLRYRFTNLRVTVMSGLTGADRKDFSYKAIKDVKYVPRFIGEWGDVVITLTDGTQVELKSVPRFKEIAQYCLEKANKDKDGWSTTGKGIARRPKRSKEDSLIKNEEEFQEGQNRLLCRVIKKAHFL